MRLHELDRQQINEAVQALAIPVIGFVSPAAAANILGFLGVSGLAAYYTSKELQKVKIDFPGAWENISSALEKTSEQVSNGAMMANPTIMTAIILKKFMDNPASFNNPETVNSAINSSAEESMNTDVGARPEVTASGGRDKKNQLARQAAWDAAYGQTHLYNGKANPDAGKIDPGLVRAQAAYAAKIEAEAQANREDSLANTISSNVAPEVYDDIEGLQTQINNEIEKSGITSFKDADVTVKKEISTLKPVEIKTDKPTLGAFNPSNIEAQTKGPDATSFKAGDIVSYTSRRNPNGADAKVVKRLANGMIQLQKDGATFAVNPSQILTPVLPKPNVQTDIVGVAPNQYSLDKDGNYTPITKTIDPPAVPTSPPKLTIPNSISANTSINVPGYNAPVKVQSVSPRGIVATTTDGQTVNFRTQKQIDAITVNTAPELVKPTDKDNDINLNLPKSGVIGQNDINVGDLSKGDQAAGAHAQGGGAGGATVGGKQAGTTVVTPPMTGINVGALPAANTSATAKTDAGAVATTKKGGAPTGKGKKVRGFKLPKLPGMKNIDMDLIKWQELEPTDPLGLRSMGKGGEK